MSNRALVAGPCGLIQVVHVKWTKSERGGQGARNRGSVPEALNVPKAELARASGQFCVTHSYWGSRNSFSQPLSMDSERVAITEEYRYGCVKVSAHPDGLVARYYYDVAHGGAPDRGYEIWPAPAEPSGRFLVIRFGEWGRVCYNGRFSCIDSGHWWYEKTTVNVAWFAGEPNGRVFIDRPLSVEYRSVVHLR